MKTQIDIKSAVIGLLIGIGVMFAMGAGLSGNDNGRYQVSVGANSSIIIDTQTGHAWAESDDYFFKDKPFMTPLPH